MEFVVVKKLGLYDFGNRFTSLENIETIKSDSLLIKWWSPEMCSILKSLEISGRYNRRHPSCFVSDDTFAENLYIARLLCNYKYRMLASCRGFVKVC